MARPLHITVASPTPVFRSMVYVISIKWLSAAATPGHAAEIKDPHGVTLWKGVAPGPFFDSGLQRVESFWNEGFAVPTLDSGELYVNIA
jgi:hypothetical protein